METTWIADHYFGAQRRETLSLHPVGHCIYCGASDSNLGDEHIWPDGLGGHLILPKASCRKCETLTNDFERRAIHVTFGLARMAYGIHSRKKRKKPRQNTYQIHRPGEPAIDVPISADMPQAIVVQTPGRRASIISGEEPNPGRLVRMAGAVNLNSRWPRGYGVSVKHCSTNLFPRFLAKVAHSYAAGCIGLDSFEPYLLNIISGRDDASRSRYLGDVKWGDRPDEGTSLRVGTTSGKFYFLPGLPPTKGNLVVVQLTVFADLKLPIFEAIVGRCK